MSALGGEVKFPQAAEQVCKTSLNFIAPHCPFCFSARGYQLCCQRGYPGCSLQARALASSSVGAGGKVGVSSRSGTSASHVLLTRLRSRGPGWTLGCSDPRSGTSRSSSFCFLKPWASWWVSQKHQLWSLSLKSWCGKREKNLSVRRREGHATFVVINRIRSGQNSCSYTDGGSPR